MPNPGVAFDSTLTQGERSPGVMNASLDGVPFRLNPDSIQLSFGVKTSRTETVGGIVIQVYGVNYSDLVVTGSFGIGGWQEQAAFLERMRAQGFKQSQRDSTGTFSYNLPVAQPMRFLFPSRGYDLMVYLKDYQSPDGQTVVHDNTIINPKWTLTLFIDNDNANLAKVAADAYIARLADGIGWTQTAFNGPVSSADTQAWLSAQEAAFGVTTAQDLFALISDPSAQLKLVDVAGTGTGTPPPPSTPLIGSGRPQQAFNYFVAKGLTKVQTAGLVGNLMYESGGGSTDLLPGTIQGNGAGPGMGIAQWTNTGRWTTLKAFAVSQGKPGTDLACLSDLALQLDFVWQELTNSYSNALSLLRAATDLATAEIVVEKYYEIPQPGSSARRVAAGQAILSANP